MELCNDFLNDSNIKQYNELLIKNSNNENFGYYLVIELNDSTTKIIEWLQTLFKQNCVCIGRKHYHVFCISNKFKIINSLFPFPNGRTYKILDSDYSALVCHKLDDFEFISSSIIRYVARNKISEAIQFTKEIIKWCESSMIPKNDEIIDFIYPN